jgi:hypothetical protein
MIEKLIIIFLFIYISHTCIYGQNEKRYSYCQSEVLGKSFISDGQDHQVLVKNGKVSKLFIVFYPQFSYQVVICCNNKKTPIAFKLADNNGNIQFSNANKAYIRAWEFQFSSLMNAVIELNLIDTKIKEENITVLIGYKMLKT